MFQIFKNISNISVSILFLAQPRKIRTVTLILLLTIWAWVFDLHFSRKVDSAKINNYNPSLLFCYRANMDIQPVLNAYSCLKYLVKYVSKEETTVSKAMSVDQTDICSNYEKNFSCLFNFAWSVTTRKLFSNYIRTRVISNFSDLYQHKSTRRTRADGQIKKN